MILADYHLRSQVATHLFLLPHAFKFLLVLKVNSKDKSKGNMQSKTSFRCTSLLSVSFANVSNASILICINNTMNFHLWSTDMWNLVSHHIWCAIHMYCAVWDAFFLKKNHYSVPFMHRKHRDFACYLIFPIISF